MNIQSRWSRIVTDQVTFCRACGRPIALERDESPTVAEMVDPFLASGYLSCECGTVTPVPFAYAEDA